MAETPETLFFFEVFVDYVRLNGAGKVTLDKVKPAVAVRFLDFPTLMIYSSEDHNSSSSSDKMLSSSCASLPAAEESVTYCFKKGKSCLFKIRLGALHIHLSSTPVYTMLLDVGGGDDIPKLIGSSFMSLAKLTASIKLDVEKHGIWMPTAYGENKISCLLNLMGERIGTISLACKLVSLAASSIPNVTERKLELNTCSKMNPTKSAIAEENLNDEISVDEFQPLQPENSTVTSTPVQQPLCTDEHPVLSETSKLHVSSVCTQTEQNKKKKYRASVTEAKSGDDQLCSTFCPPPLFYSSSKRNQQQLFAESYRMVNGTAEGLRMLDLKTADWDNESCGMEHVHRNKEEPKRSEEDRLHPSSGTLISQTEPTVLRDALMQLPLLSTLLIELSHLNGQLQLQPPLPVQCAQKGSSQTNVLQSDISLGQESVHSLVHKDSMAESTGRNTHGNPHVSPKTCMSPFISTKKQPVVTKSYQELSHPKQKLRYGLTHSFRLRLKQIKPGLTSHRECMEKSKTRLTVEPQKKTYVKLKQDHPSASQSFSRDLEECGETTELDCVLPETSGLSHSQNQKSSNQKSSTEKDFHNKRDNVQQVHVHCAHSQHFDHTAHDNETDPFYLVQDSTDLRGSDGSYVGNNRHYRPSHRSDSNSESSLEPCKYQDDFTSLDPTDGSPNPLSSPEPSRPQMTQFSSGSSSSGSSVHRSRSHPVPVKTQTSPKRSLKGTRVIKLLTATLSDSTSSSGSSDDGKSRTSVHPQRSSESYSSFPDSPTVSRNIESPKSDHANESAPVKEQYVDKFQTSDEFMLESVSSTDHEEEMDKLGSLGLQNKYLPISKLAVNQLPGYTL